MRGTFSASFMARFCSSQTKGFFLQLVEGEMKNLTLQTFLVSGLAWDVFFGEKSSTRGSSE